MKTFLNTALVCSAITFTACSSKQNQITDSTNYSENTAPATPPAEAADVTFSKQGKDIGTVVIEDTDSGISVIFNSKKLQKGKYELYLVDTCKSVKPKRNRLPEKNTKRLLGEFTTNSGDTSSDFSKPGFSVGERFISLNGKNVSLEMKSKKKSSSIIACSPIVKR